MRCRIYSKLRERSDAGWAALPMVAATLWLLTTTYTAALAAANDMLLTFSTTGPDTYMDGTTVLDGESYALVWTKNGATFGGIGADGKLLSTNDQIVLVAGLAEKGKCPTTVYEIDAADYAVYQGGSFSLYLLDTRVKDADGKVSVAGANILALSAPGAVNALGPASDTSTSATTNAPPSPVAFTNASAVALGSVGVYAKIDAPRITDIQVGDESVAISVTNTFMTADYFVVPGSTPTSFSPALKVKPVNGTFTFTKPKDDTFFKVIGARKFE